MSETAGDRRSGDRNTPALSPRSGRCVSASVEHRRGQSEPVQVRGFDRAGIEPNDRTRLRESALIPSTASRRLLCAPELWLSGNGLQTVCRNACRGFRGRNKAADANRCAGRVWNWLGGRDSNPDTVVQRAVNLRRCASVLSVLPRFSPPTLRFAHVPSGLFLRRMSHCVSGRSR
jgi:hypothetical protein